MIDQINTEKEAGLKMHREHHRKYLWTYYSLIAIGAWLITGFFPMGYDTVAMKVNDVVCGALLVVLGFLSLKPTRYWAMWIAAIIGGWLCVAPLILHARTASEYVTDTILGILIMVFLLVADITGILNKLIIRF